MSLARRIDRQGSARVHYSSALSARLINNHPRVVPGGPTYGTKKPDVVLAERCLPLLC